MVRKLSHVTPPMGRPGTGPDRWPRALSTAAVAWLATSSAWSAPIPVSNHSFEDLPGAGLPIVCGTGCTYSEDLIPGWINVPFQGIGLTSGQFRPGSPGNTTYFDALSDGPTSAYTSISCIEQTVGVMVQPGLTYTLLVDVGWRNDANPTGVPRLRVNNAYYDGIGTAVIGGWATFTCTYVGQAQDAGLPITICLASVSIQGNFDNVRLSDSNAPTGLDPVMPPPQLRLSARPNPFGAVTQVGFSIARNSPVVLRVFDVSGRAVRTLLPASNLEAGPHQVTWDGADDAGIMVGSGLYLLRLETVEGSRVERVMLVR